MFEWIRDRLLHFARVPHAPEPPAGAPDSVRIFRAGRNYYKLRLARWMIGQAGAVIGILFSVGFLYWFRGEVHRAQLEREQSAIAPVTATAPATTPATPAPNAPASGASTSPAATSTLAPAKANSTDPAQAKSKRSKRSAVRDFKVLARMTPNWVMILIEIVEVGGILLFLVQLPVTFAAVRLEFELHWYIVTDRSLRIRTGLVRLQESTMSFANLQQVEVKQGPLQRLLGLADLRVQSAGGRDDATAEAGGDSLHTGVFHSVDNATEIRDLILARLKKFRETGLGDPDDHHRPPHEGTVVAPAASADSMAAAQELLAEARALRQAMG